MQPTKIIDKSTLLFSLGLFFVLTCLSILFYQFATGLSDIPEQLALLRQQLTISILVISLIGSSLFALYRRKQLHPLNGKCNATHPIDYDKKRLNILSVDDNKANLLIIKNHLSNHNIKLFLASSGKEALAIYQKQTIDMILMDLEMAEMNGIETTQAIRLIEKDKPEKYQRTPIIAVSAHNENEKKLTVLAADLDDYLEKPVKNDQLCITINRWRKDAPVESPQQITATTAARTNKDNSTQKASTNRTDDTTIPTQHHKIVDIQLSLKHSNNNAQLAKDMLELLIQMVRAEKNILASHQENQDWDELYKLNHKLYGGSSYCGVPQLQESNKQLEHLLKQKISDDTIDTKQIDQAVTQLLCAIDAIIEWDDEHDIGIILGLEE